ncbi:putative tail assembly protein [Escherichia coli]|nr:putative tail assembly protein [Escherichia coli]
MATTNAFCLASPPLARICLHGDLQRFGRRLSLYVNTAAEAIRALSMQMPGFRRQMNEGWYQIRIAGYDMAPEAVYARLHEQLGEGTVIHIVPRLAGAGKGGLQIVLGAAAIVGSFFTAGATMALWGSALAAGGFSATTMLFSLGASMILGGVAQMLAPKAKTAGVQKYGITVNRTRIFRHGQHDCPGETRCRCLTVKCWLAPGESPRTSAPVMKVVAGRWWLSGDRDKT